MPNGFSVERMLEMVLEGQGNMSKKIDEIQQELSSVNANGCAQRKNDLLRLQVIETWKESTTNRFIGALFGIIVALSTAIYSVFKP